MNELGILPSAPRANFRDRIVLEVVTTSGRAAAVEFRFKPGTVEVWRSAHCSGIFDCHVLQTWLAAPKDPLVVDEVAFSLDRMVDHEGRIALSLPDLICWTLSPSSLASLLKRMGLPNTTVDCLQVT